MGKQVKWGVIGSGGIARRRTIPEGIADAHNAILASVYDLNSEVNRAVAEEFNASAASSLEDLLRSEIEAVYIASPANLHLDHVLACASAKKHVLCEKPLGMTVGEAEKMILACADNGVILGTALMMRFLSQHKAALALIGEGKLGKPVFGRAQLSCWYPPINGAWRQDPETGGGGSLMDMGSHCIDLLEMFFGKARSVSCFINNNVHQYRSEDSAVVSLFFENGALGTVDTYFCIPDNSSKNVLELYGSKGSILAKGTIGQGSSGHMTAFLEGDNAGYNAQQARNSAEGKEINPVPVNTYLAEIDEFTNAVLEKREPLNNGLLGLRSQLILSACYESARTGKVIKV
ncbi:MAG: Gfo/Idh/MocA family oxidoreductase [Bacteroidales bacterium]